MRQGSTLSCLHHDPLGSLVAGTDPSGTEIAWARYSPFGQLRALLGGGTLPSDRLFTGQTRDNVLGAGNAGNDAYYFFQARYYDATIGQFQSADTLVPNPKSPRALNRYAYALNNPLRLVDPSGHDSMDPNWVSRWESQHPGRGQPTQQDWLDYQFSLSHAGSGPGGAWTTSDWQDYEQTGFIQNLWYTRTTSFALMEGADQDQYGLSVRNPVTLGVDRINDPSGVTVASLAGLPGVDVGTVTVSVHKKITGRGAHLDVWLGALGSDPATRFNPKYSLSFGFPPQLEQFSEAFS